MGQRRGPGACLGWSIPSRAGTPPHGFRSTFKDWRTEQTSFPNEMSEMALGHTVSDKVEAAYRRGDMREKRRRMMADWAAFCESPGIGGSGNIVPLRASTGGS